MTLERTRIVAVALDLLDRTGLDGLTMRKLADALGIQAPSLYWHFQGKPALLDDMADALLNDVALANGPAEDFRVVLHQSADELRRAFLSRRDGARVFAGTFVIRHNMMRLADTVIGALVSAGFDSATAVRANGSLLHYVLGFTIEEQALLVRQADNAPPAAIARRFAAHMADGYPNLMAALPDFLDTDQDARFAFGLDLLIRGLGEQAAEAPAPERGVARFIELMQQAATKR
ncbi:TetR/AcrR family transcriptional regulator C-terminal domain-containing protein [uncultured Devosia sp.]|uniref:TetR/AcrR family transcriptional regulator C-terminal domain-containing protein n=1 Tax=uncultured Devosia sp. TaxID=211434 RepID=UPI0035CB71C7